MGVDLHKRLQSFSCWLILPNALRELVPDLNNSFRGGLKDIIPCTKQKSGRELKLVRGMLLCASAMA